MIDPAMELTNLITQLRDEVGAANKRIRDYKRIDAGGSRPNETIDEPSFPLGYRRLFAMVMAAPQQRPKKVRAHCSKRNLVMWPR
jgi:hypothetical protein